MLKTQTSLIALISMMVSVVQPVWAMEEQDARKRMQWGYSPVKSDEIEEEENVSSVTETSQSTSQSENGNRGVKRPRDFAGKKIGDHPVKQRKTKKHEERSEGSISSIQEASQGENGNRGVKHEGDSISELPDQPPLKRIREEETSASENGFGGNNNNQGHTWEKKGKERSPRISAEEEKETEVEDGSTPLNQSEVIACQNAWEIYQSYQTQLAKLHFENPEVYGYGFANLQSMIHEQIKNLQNMMHIIPYDFLPPEVIMNIMGHLSDREAYTLARMGRNFNEAYIEQKQLQLTLFRYLAKRQPNFNDEAMLNFLNRVSENDPRSLMELLKALINWNQDDLFQVFPARLIKRKNSKDLSRELRALKKTYPLHMVNQQLTYPVMPEEESKRYAAILQLLASNDYSPPPPR